MATRPTPLRVAYLLTGVVFVLLAIVGFVFGDQVLGDMAELSNGDRRDASTLYLFLLIGVAWFGGWLIHLSTEGDSDA